jgi:cyclopropane-fatty-acyl-phospholipid synthase
MAASALSFEAGKLGIEQVLVRRRGGEPAPLRLREWL